MSYFHSLKLSSRRNNPIYESENKKYIYACKNWLISPNLFLFSNLEVFENVVVEIRMKYDTRKNVCTTLILVYFISLFLTISIEILR